MKTIYKYELELKDEQEILLPTGAEILSAAEQKGKIVIYALVDNEIKTEEIFEFVIRGTGHPVFFHTDNYKFIGTVKLMDGALMFHVFYEKNKESRK